MAPSFKSIVAFAILMVGGTTVDPVAAVTLQERVADAAGTEPTVSENGVVRIGWQREDVTVAVDGMTLKPPAGLGSWAAFKPMDAGAMVMGDTVVFEDEITPAMDAALAHGLRVTALHNHFVFDEPPVYFMHIGGRGNPEKLAAGIKAVWDAIKAVRQAAPVPQRRFPGPTPEAEGNLDVAALQTIFDAEPSISDGVVKFTFAREGRMGDVPIGEPMGLSTWAAFSGDQRLAAVDGDFIMTATEVQPVLRALREHGIHIVALHNHMIGEDPTFYFLHYWGKDPASQLAAGVEAALDARKAVNNVPNEPSTKPSEK